MFPRFAVGGGRERAKSEQQSAAWGGGGLPTSRRDVETSAINLSECFYAQSFLFTRPNIICYFAYDLLSLRVGSPLGFGGLPAEKLSGETYGRWSTFHA